MQTVPPFGDPRISYKYLNDPSSPAEPNLTDEQGNQIPDDAQALLIDGEIVFTVETPWDSEQGCPAVWSDRELYDAWRASLRR